MPVALESRLARACGSWRGACVLVLMCLFVYVPGLWTLPAIDRDESRFAQASRQMAEAKTPLGWVVPMVQDRPRLNKPPLIYWAQAASVRAFTGEPEAGTRRNDAIWMYRLPSLLAAIATILMVWQWGRKLIPSAAAMLAAAGLAASPIFVWEAHQARADMLLVMVTTGAMWAWTTIQRSRDDVGVRRWAPVAALWVCVWLGVLVKGPITPMVVGLGTLGLCVWSRSIKPLWRIKPIVGIAAVVVLSLPWVVLVAREVGFEKYAALLHDEVIGRSLEPKEGHWGPPGYHAIASVVLLAPISLTLGLGVAVAFVRGTRSESSLSRLRLVRILHKRANRKSNKDGKKKNLTGAKPDERWLWSRYVISLVRARVLRVRDPGVLLLCLLVPSWIVFELVSTKLPHYTMPLLPVLALLAARVAVTVWADRMLVRVWFQICAVGYAITMAMFACLAFGFAAFVLDRLGSSAGSIAMGAAGVITAFGTLVCTLQLLRRRRVWRAMAVGIGACLLSSGTIMMVLPMTPDIRTSRNLAREIDMLDRAGTRDVVAIVYHEDSLIFETHGRMRRESAEGLLARLARGEAPIVILPRAELAKYPGLVERAGVAGFNYSKGKRVDLVVAEVVQRAESVGIASPKASQEQR